MKIKRIYHPYTSWEDYNNGMWREIKDKEERADLLKKAIEFIGDHKLYGKYMIKVIENWTITCEHNLTDSSLNKQAWIGHCACSLAINCPEDITREAWNYLTKEQQDLANREADKAIRLWIQNFVRRKNAQTIL